VDTVAPTVADPLTIDDLARRVELPVRTIREYHTMRLLPPPERRGRVGLYGPGHVQRLGLIARLQRRGYSLAGIRDLLKAWDTGTELATLLGVESGPVALDETPLRLSRAELSDRLPGLDEPTLGRAVATGLVHPDGADAFIVRSPALLSLAADGTRIGVALAEMVDLIGVLTDQLDALADKVAGSIVERIVWQPAGGPIRADVLTGFLGRGRLLLLQGVASTLADRLSAALVRRSAGVSGGEMLREAIHRIRVGVVTDSAGRLHQRGV
jgi:DNA-binding transcriptional MerR regulator